MGLKRFVTFINWNPCNFRLVFSPQCLLTFFTIINFHFQSVVPKYKLSLYHTPIKPDLLGFPGISVFACGLLDCMFKRFTSARNWKAMSVFCVVDSLFSDIVWIYKIWLVAQNISSHLWCFTQNSRFFTLISSLCLLPHNLLSFCLLGTEINKSKSIDFSTQSNYNFQTQESINILKTKQKKTTITISRVAMLIRMNCGRNEDTK